MEFIYWAFCHKCSIGVTKNDKMNFIMTACGHTFCKNCSKKVISTEMCTFCGENCEAVQIGYKTNERVKRYFTNASQRLHTIANIAEVQNETVQNVKEMHNIWLLNFIKEKNSVFECIHCTRNYLLAKSSRSSQTTGAVVQPVVKKIPSSGYIRPDQRNKTDNVVFQKLFADSRVGKNSGMSGNHYGATNISAETESNRARLIRHHKATENTEFQGNNYFFTGTLRKMQSGEDNQKVNVKMLEPITPTFSILPPSSIISRNSAARNSSNTAKNSAANAAAMKKLKAKPAYFSFPTQLTEEERMLQNKYKQLKKKQIAAEKMKIAPTRGHCVVESDPKAPTKRSKSPQIGARDAREIAKKLVKSGAIKIDKVPTVSNEGFKRSLGLERKLNTFEKSIGYQPFSATIMEGYGESTGKIFRKSRPEQPLTGPSGTDPVANSSSHQKKPFANEEEARAPCSSSNERGPTLYVSGESLTEDYLRELFMSYGNIIHVILVHNKKNAFVKLDNEEASHRAVRELNGSTFKDVQIEVALARRRLVFNNHRWAGLPEVMDFDKTEEQRSIISYDDI